MVTRCEALKQQGLGAHPLGKGTGSVWSVCVCCALLPAPNTLSSASPPLPPSFSIGTVAASADLSCCSVPLVLDIAQACTKPHHTHR